MNRFALVTPSYRGDLDRCALLCESVDAHVSGFSKHYVIVDDDCLQLFAHFAGSHRVVLPASQFLPRWLRNLPRFIKRKNRHYWWSFGALPVDGWQAQQILKISAACNLSEERYCILDSDIVFLRPFDLTVHARPAPLRLYCDRLALDESSAPGAHWVRSSRRLLGIGAASFPADNFVTNVVLWDQRTVRAIVDHIAAVSASSWETALCRVRYHLSEYTLYGNFVATMEEHSKCHWLSDTSLCVNYFEKEPLQLPAALQMLRRRSEDQVVSPRRHIREHRSTPFAKFCSRRHDRDVRRQSRQGGQARLVLSGHSPVEWLSGARSSRNLIPRMTLQPPTVAHLKDHGLEGLFVTCAS